MALGKRKTYGFLLFLLLAVGEETSLAQQQTIPSMSEVYRISINPAYCGAGEVSDLMFMTRQQWLGYSGAPENYYLAMQVPFQNRKMGIGLDFQRNTSGPFVQNGLFLNYAYEIKLAEESSLRFGLRAGINSYRILYSRLLLLDPGDELFGQDVMQRILPNAGAGIVYTWKDLYMEISAPLLLSNELASGKEDKTGMLNREARLLHFESGISLSLAEGVAMKPGIGIWLNQSAPGLVDLKLTTVIRDVASFGLTYRVKGAFSGSFTYRIKDKWFIGYAYELPVGISYRASSGTHELALGFDLQFLKGKTVSPRKF
jgi:type IX secretion system PorP/SprF family membrane protein